MTAMASPPAPPANGGALSKPHGLTLRDLLEKKRDLIADVLPKHMTPERLIKLATVATARDPILSRATGLSIVNAVIKAAELGLDCSGTLGSAYLVAFKNSKKDEHGNWTKVVEAQLIIGYRGLIDLARRSGQIHSIEARVVWQNDEFDFEYGLEPRLKHKPVLDKDHGPLRLVYAIAKLRDGAIQVEVMTKGEIDAIKARSQSARSEKSPWHTDYPEMARKTVVKRLCKYLPLSVEIQEVIAEDNRADPIDVIDGQLVQLPNAADRLNAKVTGRPLSHGQTLVDDDDNPLATGDEGGEGDPGAQGEPTAEQQAQAELQNHSFDRPGAEGEQTGPTEADVAGVDAQPPEDPSPTMTPREKFMAQVEEACAAVGIAWDKDAKKQVGRWALGAGPKDAKGSGTSVVNKEHEATAEAKAALFDAIQQKRGVFAYAAS